jgi:hypothetical protein
MTTKDWLEALGLFLVAVIVSALWWRGRRGYDPLDHTPGMNPYAMRERDVQQTKAGYSNGGGNAA